MTPTSHLAVDILIVLAAGFASGVICKRINVSLLVGYMLVGAIIGDGGLGFVSQENHELEYLARAGALLLLFAVGIEFSLEELVRLRSYFLTGGTVQMLLVIVPLSCICLLLGMKWQPALLLGTAGALSSTVLVFKALTECGQTTTRHGRRAIGILLFQDVALVPFMLVIPFLTGTGQSPTVALVGLLIVKSMGFVAAIFVLRRLVFTWVVPLLAELRSVELVVLFTLTLLGGVCQLSLMLALPPALGALGAGLILSGNRLSKQVDTLILPFRESFAALFFVTLGTLLHPMSFFDEPILLSVGIVAVLVLKTGAAAVALKLIGLNWKSAAGMGLGLAQLGEFSFLIIAEGSRHGVIETVNYNRMLFIALGTLILTPQLLKYGLRWTEFGVTEVHEEAIPSVTHDAPIRKALVIGLGLAGRQIALRLEQSGVGFTLVDQSPINLHPFAQAGHSILIGDARDPATYRAIDIPGFHLAVVCVPDDESARQIVKSLRESSNTLHIVVRCRYLENAAVIRRAGANAIISEEQQVTDALVDLCERVFPALEANPGTTSSDQIE